MIEFRRIWEKNNRKELSKEFNKYFNPICEKCLILLMVATLSTLLKDISIKQSPQIL